MAKRTTEHLGNAGKSITRVGFQRDWTAEQIAAAIRELPQRVVALAAQRETPLDGPSGRVPDATRSERSA